MTNSVAIVTGASQGIGRNTAELQERKNLVSREFRGLLLPAI